MWPPKQGLKIFFFWYSQSDNHPENNLAKFGYNNTYEGFFFKKKTESFNILGYLLEVIIRLWLFGNLVQGLSVLRRTFQPPFFKPSLAGTYVAFEYVKPRDGNPDRPLGKFAASISPTHLEIEVSPRSWDKHECWSFTKCVAFQCTCDVGVGRHENKMKQWWKNIKI
jgi:hypothetical protein